MNANIFAALFQDSLQQVLDNRVFRLLVIMTICMVAPTFLIGFHQDHISMLWMWEYSYSELTATLGVPVPPDVRSVAAHCGCAQILDDDDSQPHPQQAVVLP